MAPGKYVACAGAADRVAIRVQMARGRTVSLAGRSKVELQKTALYRAFRRMRDDAQLGRWVREGRPVPPPSVIKQAVLLDHGRRYGLRLLIETGTHYGHTVDALRGAFDDVHSIELDDWLYDRATRRFRDARNVHLYHGDSAEVLPKLLASLTQPALFWLDGHYSGAGTARGKSDTPLGEELDAVLAHPVQGHVVLIDDARHLGTSDYPTAEALIRTVRERRPDLRIEIAEDIVRITPVLSDARAPT